MNNIWASLRTTLPEGAGNRFEQVISGLFLGTGVGFLGISLMFGAWWNLGAWAMLGIGVFRVDRYHRIVTDLNAEEGADHEMLEQGLRINRLSPIIFTVIALVVVGLSFTYRYVSNNNSEAFLAAKTVHLERAWRLCSFELPSNALLFKASVITDFPGTDTPVLVAEARSAPAFPVDERDLSSYVDAIGTQEMPGPADTLLCYESERIAVLPVQRCDGMSLQQIRVTLEAHSLTDNRSGIATTTGFAETCSVEQTVTASTQPTDDQLMAVAVEAVANME